MKRYPTIGKTFCFQTSVVYIKRLHQEAGGDQLEPIPCSKYKQWRPASSSSSTWWKWQRILVVFLRIHRQSRRKRQAKACGRSGQPVVYRTLAKTSDEWLSRIHFILLQQDRLQLTAVYCNRREVVKTTPQKTRFRDVKYARIWNTA